MATRNVDSVRPGSKKKNAPKVIGVVLREYFQSNEPLAAAFRDRLFRDAFPNTELGVDLKLITRKHGRLKMGEMIDGTIVRDSEDHYLFMERMFKMAERQTPRNAHLYEGQYINVNMRPDGVIYPTFRYGQLFNDNFTFADFCREAAEELRVVSGLVGKERK